MIKIYEDTFNSKMKDLSVEDAKNMMSSINDISAEKILNNFKGNFEKMNHVELFCVNNIISMLISMIESEDDYSDIISMVYAILGSNVSKC